MTENIPALNGLARCARWVLLNLSGQLIKRIPGLGLSADASTAKEYAGAASNRAL
jgi:hypothetical protein